MHDEIVFEVEDDWTDEIGEMVSYQMERALEDVDTGEYHSRVRILTDGKTTDQWEK